ncbi:MAG: hypothetical protein AAB586_01175, partial [Patescibacteria group bacterium]
ARRAQSVPFGYFQTDTASWEMKQLARQPFFGEISSRFACLPKPRRRREFSIKFEPTFLTGSFALIDKSISFSLKIPYRLAAERSEAGNSHLQNPFWRCIFKNSSNCISSPRRARLGCGGAKQLWRWFAHRRRQHRH